MVPRVPLAEIDALTLSDFKNGDDIGMTQLRRGACLVLETQDLVRITNKLRRQHRYRDLPSQTLVARQPDFTDAARAEPR